MEPAPKKRTVRRGTVKPAVIVPEPAVAKKPRTATKKTVTKSASVKKVTAKSTTKTESIPIKKTVKRGIKSPFSAEVMAEVTETNVDQETVKLITGPLSPRLKEKLALYELWYQTEAPKYMEGTAKLFGYTFIITGFLLVLGLSFKTTPLGQSLFATLPCSLSSCTPTMSTSTESSASVLPAVEFQGTPTVTAGTDTDFTLTVTTAKSHDLYLRSLETGARTLVKPAGDNGAGVYTYRLPTATLLPGDYQVEVKATALTENTTALFSGPMFSIGEVKVPKEPATEKAPSDDESVATTTEEALPSVLGASTTTAMTEESPASTTDDVEEVVVEKEEPTTVSTDAVMLVSVKPGVFNDQHTVSVVPTFEYSTVELSIRPRHSVSSVFLGSATKTKAGWAYWIDATTLPQGEYEIIVTGYDDGEAKETVTVDFDNVFTTAQSESYSDEQAEVAATIDSLAGEASGTTATLADPRTSLVSELDAYGLSDYAARLDPLYRLYASAFQSGNRAAEDMATADILRAQEELIDSSLPNDSGSVAELETRLKQLHEAIMKQIVTIETLKKERTAAASTLDTDSDGLTDFDEYLLYETNPSLADTDLDGVVDGVEIGRGFDPTDASPEAVIRYRTPLSGVYSDDELLGVLKVTPLLVYETDNPTPRVESEINGFGLPNSFVTLRIDKEQAIVTAKTGADGSFSYTFSRELTDGVHSVNASLTDNTGAVVAESSPFTFEKRGQSYREPRAVVSPADLTAAPITTSETTPYNLVATVGVIGFGLILLLLAMNLRQERLVAKAGS